MMRAGSLPPLQQQSVDRLVSLKTLALSSTPSDLAGIGNAAFSVHDNLHDQIYQAVMVKARRVEASLQRVTDKELEEIEIDGAKFSYGDHDAEHLSEGSNKRVLAQCVGMTCKFRPLSGQNTASNAVAKVIFASNNISVAHFCIYHPGMDQLQPFTGRR